MRTHSIVTLSLILPLQLHYSSPIVSAFSPPLLTKRPLPSLSTRLHATPDNNNDDINDDNLVSKASWYAVEAFGKVFGKSTATTARDNNKNMNVDLSRPPSSLKEAIRRIELDNDRSYFLSGEVDVEAYNENCVFSDPFVAFSGRDRFVENLANLGSFITKYNAKMLQFDVDDSAPLVQTKVMVKLELNLPWKPVLAWPWGVTYVMDPNTFLVMEHKESWDIAPMEGVKQIFRKPTTTVKSSLQ